MRDRWIALALLASFAAQGALVGSWHIAACGVAAAVLWRARTLLNSHADMLLLMGGFGGLGMALGSLLDGPHAACLRNPWNPVSWMTGGMLLLGFAPAIPWSRCLLEARRLGLLWPAILLDAAGMWAGMALSHIVPRWLGFGMLPAAVGHAAMTVGMLVGMAVTMMLRPMLYHRARRSRRTVVLSNTAAAARR